jgi:hypothetical protein
LTSVRIEYIHMYVCTMKRMFGDVHMCMYMVAR